VIEDAIAELAVGSEAGAVAILDAVSRLTLVEREVSLLTR